MPVQIFRTIEVGDLLVSADNRVWRVARCEVRDGESKTVAIPLLSANDSDILDELMAAQRDDEPLAVFQDVGSLEKVGEIFFAVSEDCCF